MGRKRQVLPNSTDIDILGPWAWAQIGQGMWYPEGKSGMGYIHPLTKKPTWAVIFDDYEEFGSIKMHVALTTPKCVTRRAIQAVFEYPFSQLGVKKVLATVNSENHAALSFDLRLGFKVEAVIKDAYERGDMYILSMTQDQCRWIRGKTHGKCEESSAAA